MYRLFQLLHTGNFFVVVIGLAALVQSRPLPAEVIERRCWSMGTTLDLSVEAGDRASALRAAEAAVRAVEAAERRLSTWREDSELSVFNRSRPGGWVALSDELVADLGGALAWAGRTNGWFNPGIAPLVRAWDLRGQGRRPSQQEIAVALAGSRSGAVEVRGSFARRLEAAAGVEEGGFAKGIALREGADAALETGAMCVSFNFGGQTHRAGDCGVTDVIIAHPHDRARTIAAFEMTSGSCATSGNSERGITVDGVKVGHLLNPKTGQPAADFGSVTVLAHDPLASDCVATALYAMGPARGMQWLRSITGVEAVFVIVAAEGVELVATDGLLDRLRTEETRVRLKVTTVVDVDLLAQTGASASPTG